jgi:hypothetical protein
MSSRWELIRCSSHHGLRNRCTIEQSDWVLSKMLVKTTKMADLAAFSGFSNLLKSEADGEQPSRLYGSSHPEAKSVESDVDIALEANGRADELALVPPRTAADHAVAWIAALEPR